MILDTSALEQRLADLEARLERLETAQGAPKAHPVTAEAFKPLQAVSEVANISVRAIVGRHHHKNEAVTAARVAVAHVMRRRGFSAIQTGKALDRDRSLVHRWLRKPAPAELVAKAERLLGGRNGM